MYRAILLICCLWTAAATAQIQVQSGGAQTPPRSRDTAAGAGNSNELMVSFYNQLETLKQEVQTLRGLVEEQNYLIKRMQNDSGERYLELDRRIQELSVMNTIVVDPNDPNAPISAAGALPGATVQTQIGDVRTTVPFNPALQSIEPKTNTGESVLPTLEIEQLSEQDLYRTALNLLLEESNSTDAIVLFQNYIDRFPMGRLMPNALYWQGEALILVSRYPQAAAAFERVLKDFPDDAKAAGAMLKLGVVYNLMGDRGLAAQTWRDLPIRYPDSTSENTLAKDYLNKLK